LWSQGECGELIFYALLTIACDHTYGEEMEHIKACYKLTLDSVLLGHEPVLICAFLKHFVGEQEWDIVANAKPINIYSDNANLKTVKDFLGEQAMVDFTCFMVA
jgi:hypothetical protein